VYRYNVGDIRVTVLSDGFRIIPSLDDYILNAPTEELLATLAAAGLPTDHLKSFYNPILVETGGRRVLIETGIGEAMFQSMAGQRGRLLLNLAAAGVDRGDIDVVAISHFHPDHVNGLLLADGTPAFPSAEILVPRPEWDHWMDDAEMARAPEGRITELFHNCRRVFDGLGRKVTCFDWGHEIAPGVTSVATPGHSVGHTAFVLGSGAERVFVQGDLNNQEIVFSRHVDWQFGFDHDPEQACLARRQVYDMLAREKIPVQAYHHPFPGLGRVEREGAAFRVVPIA
jgi:glyoxylase-like metal-dependent hydrolase (beta-lactamase superfamily II)